MKGPVVPSFESEEIELLPRKSAKISSVELLNRAQLQPSPSIRCIQHHPIPRTLLVQCPMKICWPAAHPPKIVHCFLCALVSQNGTWLKIHNSVLLIPFCCS